MYGKVATRSLSVENNGGGSLATQIQFSTATATPRPSNSVNHRNQAHSDAPLAAYIALLMATLGWLWASTSGLVVASERPTRLPAVEQIVEPEQPSKPSAPAVSPFQVELLLPRLVTDGSAPTAKPIAHPIRLPKVVRGKTISDGTGGATSGLSIRIKDPVFHPASPEPLQSPAALNHPAQQESEINTSDFDHPTEGFTPNVLDDSITSSAHADCVCSDYSSDFSPTPLPNAAMFHDESREQWVYDAKHNVPTQHPWVEWGRIFYGSGITPRGKNWFGHTNMVRPEFYVYGDFRSGIASGRNAVGRTDNWASRLNLDFDLQLTDTERFHAFVGPLDRDGRFTRWEKRGGDFKYFAEHDLNPVTGFFEGDLGVMMGAARSDRPPFELPITIGLVPLLFQNGIWMEDAVTGAAIALPARHSRLLNWSNYDATFFAIADQLNSPAFGGDEHAAQALGTAWFIEAYGGYIETGYAYVRDRNQSERSYHNITASFTRRYFDRVSNSVRVIVNTGQDSAKNQRTADGGLLLIENSWITDSPLTFVPYANFFYGWDRPQSVARAGVAGGILRNTGINFDTDGLNGFATLDPTANDTAGGAIGVDLIGDDLDRQLLLEVAYLAPHGGNTANVPDDQFAAGSRYQFPISNWTLLRFDVMYGWRRGLDDVYGTRMEYRWKF